ncbi:hypothetical protein N9868_02950 [Akkermansiaceae bacterium]|nr:hypothetical protein [Akkermansiaceae bacterium]MDB4299791.1 hypothetical protein [bacterium]MDA7535488.1 hypothetical protein [Akkermansiaceae bacterium]MDA7649257.1 hypothetical protein [Akkermansiaceae bacterium]MDA7684379.1 hypothetical protein [Akkermansiaceae bacterium]
MSEESEDRPNSQEPEPQDGMEKRVRRVKGKRRSKKSSGSSLFNKGKELLHGIQEEDDDSGHVNVAEQVRRLTKDKDEDRPLDEVWGSKKRSTSWLWVSLFAVIIPLVGVGIGVSYLTKDRTGESADDVEVVEIFTGTDEDQATAHDWFVDDSMVWLDKAVKIIRTVNAAEGPEEFIASVRPSPYREFNPVDLSQWQSPMVIDTLQDISWALPAVTAPGGNEGSAMGYLEISGTRANNDDVTVFFVESDGELLLDWDASTAWSQMPISKFIEEKPQGGAILRVKIDKKRIYDEVVNGVTYSGYLATSGDGADFFFCYIPLDSVKQRIDDERLKTILNYGRFIGKLRHDQPLTVRVRFGDGKGGGKRFEIMDLLHDKWVRP